MNVYEHFMYFADKIGPRPLGSDANKQAVEYACEVLSACGLPVVRQSFDCMKWLDGGATLTVDGKELPARPAPYAAPCDAKGELVIVETTEALASADLRGKIALLRGEIAREELMPKDNPFWYPDEHKAIVDRLEGAGLKALLTAGLPDSGAPMIDDGGFEVPCAVIAREDADVLKDGALIHLKIDTERGQTRGCNVTALMGEGEKRVCFCAHLDTKAFTPGALDDASGSAVVLALAQALKGAKLPFAVEFTLFSGEDNYANDGEMLYLNESLSEPSKYLWAANIDGVGMPDCDTTIALFECPHALSKLARELPQTGWSEIEPWPQGDHSLFAMSGIPAIALTSHDIFTAPLHSPKDNIDGVSAEKLAQTVEYLKGLVLKYAGREG